LIGRDFEAVALGLLDEMGGGVDFAPVGLLAGFEMRDVPRQIAAAGDVDKLLDRFEQLVAFVADVTGVDAAVLAGDGGEGNELVLIGV